MAKCIRCGSERIIEISGKTSDCFNASYAGKEYDGYVPETLGIGEGGDYIEFKHCAYCGQIQGRFPLSHDKIIKEFEDNE